ncbi:MAG: hypothetical protein IT342_12605 [Candidatus Melainabacteria bacterium]|nr:hypothetical protein [Candidatus Melainabacteria bacterium]
MKRLSTQFVLLLLTAMLMQGCSRDTSGGTAVVGSKTEQPSASAAENAYKNRSKEFPSDFPLPKYPNSQVEIAHLRTTRSSAPIVVLQTTDSVHSVFLFYAKSLKETGWDIGKVVKRQTYMMLAATKNGRETTVMISETRKGTTAISLFAGRK